MKIEHKKIYNMKIKHDSWDNDEVRKIREGKLMDAIENLESMTGFIDQDVVRRDRLVRIGKRCCPDGIDRLDADDIIKAIGKNGIVTASDVEYLKIFGDMTELDFNRDHLESEFLDMFGEMWK